MYGSKRSADSVGGLRETDCLEDIGLNVRIILKWILK
jgi:hypothetical protein